MKMCRPQKQISPFPSLSGLSSFVLQPGNTFPQLEDISQEYVYSKDFTSGLTTCCPTAAAANFAHNFALHMSEKDMKNLILNTQKYSVKLHTASLSINTKPTGLLKENQGH